MSLSQVGQGKLQIKVYSIIRRSSRVSGNPRTQLQSQFLHAQKEIVCHRSGGNSSVPLLIPSNSTRKMLLFGFKNRTLKLDFYGLVKNTAHALPHLVSAPAWPHPAAQKQLCTSSAGSFSRDGVPGRFMSSALAEASSHGSQPQSSCSHIPCSSG